MPLPETSVTSIVIRPAQIADVADILAFIRELAEYERLAHTVETTEDHLRKSLFGDSPAAEALIAEFDGKAVGWALFFTTFSTFKGLPGIYVEDIYVRPPVRGQGVGKALLRRIAQLAVDRGCGRVEWAVLDWNEPSIEFYRGVGAQPLDEWTTYRLTGESLTKLAGV
jgi:GNAT superfamily N-acetyltransferase